MAVAVAAETAALKTTACLTSGTKTSVDVTAAGLAARCYSASTENPYYLSFLFPNGLADPYGPYF